MLTFSDFLNEALITFGGKAYPKYGTVVIMAGGSASGKGFVVKNLLGVEAKVMDVDAIKTLAAKSDIIVNRLKKETGRDLRQLDFKNPEDVSFSHLALDGKKSSKSVVKGYQNKSLDAVEKGNKAHLPNIIFDVTLSEMSKFTELTERLEKIGYDPRNIHIVWVVADRDVAIKQNASRSRTVPEDILIGSHSGAAKTLHALVNDPHILHNSHMDGDIWFVFNNKEAGDTKLKKSNRGGSFIEKQNYFKIKKAGSNKIAQIPQAFLDKLLDYTKTKFN